MFDLSVRQLAQLIDGQLHLGGPPPLDGGLTSVGRIVLEARRVARGDVYWAVDQVMHGGHQHAEEAQARGAAGVVSTRHIPPWAGCWSILVDDSRDALARLVTARPPVGTCVATEGRFGKVLDAARHATPDMLTDALMELRGLKATGRRWVVAGDLCSPRWDSGDVHRQLGAQAVVAGGVDRLVACGRFAPQIAEGACEVGLRESHAEACPRIVDAIHVLRAELLPGDVVLTLGSRHLAMTPIVRLLSSNTAAAA